MYIITLTIKLSKTVIKVRHCALSPIGSIQILTMSEEYGYAKTTRHCVIENRGRFGTLSFLLGRFSLGLLHTSQQRQHVRLLFDIGVQKVKPDRILQQCAGVWFD